MDNEDLKRIISKNLIHFRKSAKLTQAELAEKINYSDKSVSKWERGEGVPDIFVLQRIAELYGVTVNDIISEDSLFKKIKIPLTNKNKAVVSCLSAGLVWLIATISFVILNAVLGYIKASFNFSWIVFVYSVPLSAIVVLVLSKVWKLKSVSFLFLSVLIWGAALSLHLSSVAFSFPIGSLKLVYLIAAVLQVLAILWYLFKHFKSKKL